MTFKSVVTTALLNCETYVLALTSIELNILPFHHLRPNPPLFIRAHQHQFSIQRQPTARRRVNVNTHKNSMNFSFLSSDPTSFSDSKMVTKVLHIAEPMLCGTMPTHEPTTNLNTHFKRKKHSFVHIISLLNT